MEFGISGISKDCLDDFERLRKFLLENNIVDLKIIDDPAKGAVRFKLVHRKIDYLASKVDEKELLEMKKQLHKYMEKVDSLKKRLSESEKKIKDSERVEKENERVIEKMTEEIKGLKEEYRLLERNNRFKENEIQRQSKEYGKLELKFEDKKKECNKLKQEVKVGVL